MPKKKSTKEDPPILPKPDPGLIAKISPRKETNIKIGDVSGISGNVSVAGGNITTHQNSSGSSATEIKELFERLYTAIENAKASPADKEDLKAELEEIQSTMTEAVQKNEKLQESFLSRRFRNIARMAPDILEMAVATLGGPLAGLGVAAKMIAEKAKEEIKAA
jgi:hypothetical protein